MNVRPTNRSGIKGGEGVGNNHARAIGPEKWINDALQSGFYAKGRNSIGVFIFFHKQSPRKLHPILERGSPPCLFFY